MSLIAPHITAFLQERLPRERRASVHTCDSYAYAFQLLFSYAGERLKVQPSELHFEQVDAPLVVNFLNHLESARHNRPSSRNIRLAAIRSFMRYMQYRLPAAMEQIQRVLAIPVKKTDTRIVPYLARQETQFLLDAPDPANRLGIRDRAMLHLCFAAGLRVSELVGLGLQDLQLQPQPSVLVHGQGRRERALPLWKPIAAGRSLGARTLPQCAGTEPDPFRVRVHSSQTPSSRGQAVSHSPLEAGVSSCIEAFLRDDGSPGHPRPTKSMLVAGSCQPANDGNVHASGSGGEA